MFERLREASVDFGTAVALVSANFEVWWANERFLALLGRDLDDIRNRDIRSFRTDDRPLYPERMSMMESEYLDAFGDVVPTHTTVIPIFAEGAWVGHVLLESPQRGDVTDVALLRQSLMSTESLLKESQLLYKALYENSTDLIQSANTRGQLMFVNDTWRRVMGYTDREASRLEMSEVLVAPDLLPIFHGEVAAPTDRLRFQLRRRSGEELWVEGTISYRYVDERVVGTHAILSDITERERLERMKAQFIAMVNHELRTPLTSIVGALNLLRDGVAPLDDKARRFVDIALRNANRLSTLVQEVLDFEKLAAGKLDVEEQPVDLRGFLSGLREDYVGFATGHQVQIDEPEGDDVVVDTDPAILRHIIGNFLANAVRFAGGNARVRFGVTRGRDVVRLWVHDRGRGLGIPFRAIAFRPFEQDRDTSGGTGLGLSIASSMAERLGAEVGFVSISDAGTTFFVDLSAPAQPHEPPMIVADELDLGELVLAAGRQPDMNLRFEVAQDIESLLVELATSRAQMRVTLPPGYPGRTPVSETVVFETQNDQ